MKPTENTPPLNVAAKFVTQGFQSGTIIVRRNDGGPWLYVYGPRTGDEEFDQNNRWKMADELRDHMNDLVSSNMPWFCEMKFDIRSQTWNGLDGSKIIICGPMFDADPPSCNWKERDDPEAVKMRDRLFWLVVERCGK